MPTWSQQNTPQCTLAQLTAGKLSCTVPLNNASTLNNPAYDGVRGAYPCMDLLALSHMTCAAKRSITRTAHRYTTVFRTPATHGSDRGADGGGQARIGKGARSGKNDAKAAVAGYNTKTDANKDKDVGTRQDTSHETTSIRDHISSPTLHVAARRSRQENRHLKSLDLHRDQRQFLTPRPAPLEPTIPPLDLQYHTSDLKLSKHQKPRTVRQHNPGT